MRFLNYCSSHTCQDDLKEELDALEQEQLDDRLAGADRVPSHLPASPVGQTTGRKSFFYCSPGSPGIADCYNFVGAAVEEDEDDEEAQLRKLQAELAM